MLNLQGLDPPLLWLGLAAALLAVEVLTGTGWLLWASASAAAVAAGAAFGGLGLTACLALFAALTAVSTLLARRYLPKSVRASGGDLNDSAFRLLGQTGRVVTAFERGSGRVFVDGKEWAAQLEGEGAPGVGAAVQVTGATGSVLKVRLP